MKDITFGRVLATIPDNEFNYGFIYKVTELSTGRHYIGLKHFHSYRTPKGKKNKKKFESDWKTYTTSNNELKYSIKKDINNYEFEIICFCKDKPSLKYEEVRQMVIHNSLTDPLSINENIQIKLQCKLKNYDKRVLYNS